MNRRQGIQHEFVEFIPDDVQDGVLYLSIPYATAVHLCCCGCGHKVVTPLSPKDWSLTFDGESVSLEPSIDNWSFPCQSHYWVRRNCIRWDRHWSPDEIEALRNVRRADATSAEATRAVVAPAALVPARGQGLRALLDRIFRGSR